MKWFLFCILLVFVAVSQAKTRKQQDDEDNSATTDDDSSVAEADSAEDVGENPVFKKLVHQHSRSGETTGGSPDLEGGDHEEKAHLESIGEKDDADEELTALNITIDENRVEHPCITPGYIFDPINLYTEDKLLLEGRNDTTPLEMRRERRGWRNFYINRYYSVWRDRFYVKNGDGIITVQLRDGEATSGATLLGLEDNWRHEYILAKMNIFFSYSRYHGSQHAIRGETYPLEIQLVHYKKGTASLDAAANEKHGILVLCFLFEQRGRPNQWLEPLANAADKAVHPMDKLVIVHGPLHLKALFPMDLSNLQYTGPYYAKPCAREAKYIVFATVNTVSEKQMNKFREIRDFNGDIHPGIFGQFAGESGMEGLGVHVSKNVKLRPLRKVNLSRGSHLEAPPFSAFAVAIILIIVIFVLL